MSAEREILPVLAALLGSEEQHSAALGEIGRDLGAVKRGLDEIGDELAQARRDQQGGFALLHAELAHAAEDEHAARAKAQSDLEVIKGALGSLLGRVSALMDRVDGLEPRLRSVESAMDRRSNGHA